MVTSGLIILCPRQIKHFLDPKRINELITIITTGKKTKKKKKTIKHGNTK